MTVLWLFLGWAVRLVYRSMFFKVLLVFHLPPFIANRDRYLRIKDTPVVKWINSFYATGPVFIE